MSQSRSITATTTSSRVPSRAGSLRPPGAVSPHGGQYMGNGELGDADIGAGGVDDEATDTDVDPEVAGALAVPVETLVEHLLAARRALGTISQVLRGNELATQAHELHTETVVLASQTASLRHGIREQVNVLVRMRASMGRAYSAGQHNFRSLIRTLDAANGQLEHTMAILRATTVAAIFRPEGEAPRNLLDFVDETGVEALQNAIKESIAELQAAQTSFDGDLLRFDTDLRTLNKAMIAAPATPPPLPMATDEDYEAPTAAAVPHLLAVLTSRSHNMAKNLDSLNHHFDMCVTAVRTTEGGSALARWRAAQSQDGTASHHSHSKPDPVSISGVIAEQEAASGRNGGDDDEGRLADLEPISAQERAEMLQVVLQDAAEVDEVVADMAAELQEAEAAFAEVLAHYEETQTAYMATTATLRLLDDIGGRLASYAAAETEFRERWGHEQAAVADRLRDMDDLRAFYEGYANAYDTLILEAERRRTVESKIQTIWRKAREAVDRLVVADTAERETFRHEVGEYLPTDLWVDMARPPRGHDLFQTFGESQQPQQQQQQQQQQPPPQKQKGRPAGPIKGNSSSLNHKTPMEDTGGSIPGTGSSTRTVLGR